MRIEQLKYFLDICDTQSLNQSANRLFITQPALTKSIKKLEEEIGTALFIRTKTGIYLNHTGRLFKPYAENILEQYSLSLTKVSQSLSFSLPISLFTQPILSELFISPLFDESSKQFPNLEFHLNDTLLNSSSNNLASLIQQSPLNSVLFITSLKKQNKQLLNDIDVITLLEDEVVAFIHNKHPFASEKLFTNDFLSTHDEMTLFWGRSAIDYNNKFSNASIVSNLCILRNLVLKKGYILCFPKHLGCCIFQNQNVINRPLENNTIINYQLMTSTLFSKEFIPCLRYFSSILKKLLHNSCY